MKLHINHLHTAAWVLLGIATACTSNPETPVPEGPEAQIAIYPLDADATRVTLNGTAYSWQDGDLCGIYIDAATPTTNSRGTLKRDAASEAYFSATVKASKAGNKVYAYYPYAAANPKTGDYIILPVAAGQTQTRAGVFNGTQLPMAACAATLPGDLEKNSTAALSLKFSPVASIADFAVWTSDAAFATEQVYWVSFSAEGAHLSSAAAGEGIRVSTAGLLEGSVTCDASSLTGNALKVSVAEPFAPGTQASDGRSAYLVVPAGSVSGTLKATVRTNEAFYNFTVDKGAAGVAFTRNSVKRFSLDLAKASRIVNAMPAVSVRWVTEDKVKQPDATSYKVPFVISPSSGCTAVYYTYIESNILPADLEADLLENGTKVTQWTDQSIKTWVENITTGDTPLVAYAMGVGSDGSYSKVSAAILNPASLESSAPEGPFICSILTRLGTSMEYGITDYTMPYKEIGGGMVYYSKNGYEITASEEVVSYQMGWGLYNELSTKSDAELLALARSKGFEPVIVAQENPKKLPLYVVDYEPTVTFIAWKNALGKEHLYKGHVIRSFRNGEFVSAYAW